MKIHHAAMLAFVLTATLSVANATEHTEFPIKINTSKLAAYKWTIKDNASVEKGNSSSEGERNQTVQLAPGRYQFVSALWDNFYFTVKDDGLVDYDSTLDSFISGRETNELTINGLPITIAATTLSSREWFLNVGSTQAFDRRTPVTVNLVPGGYAFTSAGRVEVGFTVTAAGTVDYEPTYNTFLSGRGTSVLTVKGFSVTIDATAVTALNWMLNGASAGSGDNMTPATFELTPGSYLFCLAAFDCIGFDLTNDGLIYYDSVADVFISGRGTNRLIVSGFPLTIAARTLAADQLTINFGNAGKQSTAEIRTVKFIPGPYFLCAPLDHCFEFNVDISGNFQISPSVEPFVWVGEGKEMIVLGFPITIDATNMIPSNPTWRLDNGSEGYYSNTRARTARLLPGTHTLCASEKCMSFTVDVIGAIKEVSVPGCASTPRHGHLDITCIQ